ncbi:MAG: FliH/SctL family protein [Acidobacteriota bacterium]|nr:FliH/SctL family protein [Acidobacteriota bacterium]
MSSKVLLPDQQRKIQPVIWKSSGQTRIRASDTPTEASSPESAHAQDFEAAGLRVHLAQVEQASRQAVQEAREQGLAEGERLGKQQGEAALQPLLTRAAQAIAELAGLRPRLREEAESDVIQLSLAIARRILHRELSIDPTAMQALARVALDRLARQEIYRVRIHPSQADALRTALSQRAQEIEIVADPRQDPGALLFETNRGKMDASVCAQFEEIERGLTDRVNQR